MAIRRMVVEMGYICVSWKKNGRGTVAQAIFMRPDGLGCTAGRAGEVIGRGDAGGGRAACCSRSSINLIHEIGPEGFRDHERVRRLEDAGPAGRMGTGTERKEGVLRLDKRLQRNGGDAGALPTD